MYGRGVRTRIEAVVASKPGRTVAFSVVLAAFGKLATVMGGQKAVEAIWRREAGAVSNEGCARRWMARDGCAHQGGQSLGRSPNRASWARIMSSWV